MLFFFISADIQVYADYKGQKMSKAIFLVVNSSNFFVKFCPKESILQITILKFKLKEVFTVMGRKSKFQVPDSDLEYWFWRYDKHIAISEKKLPLASKMDQIQNNKGPFFN